MTLSEFVKKRREELGITWADIWDAGIANNTFRNIVNEKQLTIKPVTVEKLAKLLKCSPGEIQACLAETPNPLRKEAERPEGQAGISVTAKAKQKSVETEAPAPDPVDEEPAEVFQPEPEMDFPEYHSPYQEERDAGAEEYKAKLREMVLRIMAEGIPGQDSLSDVYADVGIALVKELIGGQK